MSRRRERGTQVALGLVALFLVLMLGRHTPLYGLVYDLVPPWRPFRYPEKLTVHVAFWLAVLAGLGAETLLSRDAAGRRRAAWGALALGAGALVLAGLSHGLGVMEALRGLYSGPAESWPELARQLGERLTQGSVLVGLACGVMGLVLLRVGRSEVLGPALVALVAIDLLRVTEPVYMACDRRIFTMPPSFVEEMKQRTGSEELLGKARVYTSVSAVKTPEQEGLAPAELEVLGAAVMLSPDSGAPWGVEHANWYLPAMSSRVGDLLKDQRRWWSRYAALGSVGFFTVDEAQVRARKLGAHVVAENAPFGVSLLANPLALPRAYLAEPRCVASPEESLALISAPDFILGRQAAVECPSPLSSPAPDAPLGTATLTNISADGSTVEVDAKAPAVLVLSDAYYSGWTATLDGAPASVLPANHAFRAVAVPPGRHQVVWSYSPPGQTAAFGVSGLGIVLCVLPWLLRLRRPPRVSPSISSHNPPNMTK